MKSDLKEIVKTIILFVLLGAGFYILTSSSYYNLGIIMFILYSIIFVVVETLYLTKKKNIKVLNKIKVGYTLLAIFNLILMFAVFGTVDYYRTVKGKEPAFAYLTVSVTNFDIETAGLGNVGPVNRVGTTSSGVGYTITNCDSTTGNYTFKLGRNKALGSDCYTHITCSKEISEDNKESFSYRVFDGALEYIYIDKTMSFEKEKDVKNYEKEFNKINDIAGCRGVFNKSDNDSYRALQHCFIPNMHSFDVEEIFGKSKEALLNQTKDSIIKEHSSDKDLKCE